MLAVPTAARPGGEVAAATTAPAAPAAVSTLAATSTSTSAPGPGPGPSPAPIPAPSPTPIPVVLPPALLPSPALFPSAPAAAGPSGTTGDDDAIGAPAVIETVASAEPHTLPRRFLGPIPRRVAESDKVQERRRHVRDLRRRTVAKLLKREGAPAREIERGLADEDGQGPIARRAHKHRLRLRRRDRLNVAHDQEYELSESESSSSSSESEEEGGGWFSKKDAEAEAAWKAKKEQEKKERKAAKKAAKKAGKDSDKGKDKDNDKKDKGKKKKTKKKTDKQFRVWVGGAGFDIGREFVARDPTPAPSTAITPETLLSSDPIDVLGDELDAIQERQDTEQVADELWNTVGFPGELLPPVDESGTVLEAGQGDDDQLTGDDVSFVTAKTRPPLGIGSKGKQREDRLPDDIPFMTARTRPTMTSGSRQSRGKQSEGIAEDASFTTPTRPTMASGSRQSTGKREDLTDDASFTTLTRPPPKPISGHSSSVSSAGDSFVTALSTSLPSSHGDVPDPALTPPPGSPDASPPETPAPQRISALALGLQRPPMSPRSSTTETYRSQQTVVEVHEHGHGHGNEPQGSEPPALPAQPTVIPPSPESVANPSPHGTYSSGRPLLNASDDEGSVHAGDSPSPVRRVTSSSSRPGIPQLLKSALRPEPTETPSTTKEPKTVKWIPTSLSPKNRKAALADTSSTSSPKSQPKSQLEPANPIDVLSRTGEDARGTSAEASTKASVIDQDDFMPGGFVMRDRALVKVGRHRDEEIRVFDEEFARRDPCYRTEPMEEYIVGMTLTSIDFYVEWKFSCQEKRKGHKKLRYAIPLASPTRLSVFNQRDMMLCVTCPWSVISRQTARHQGRTMKGRAWDRVRISHTVEALGLERNGTGVFMLKFGERTRALDWHWYISGQLEMSLPKQIDIRIPSLSQTVRLVIPEEAASTTINAESTRRLLWNVVLSNSTRRELMLQLGELPRIELAWKGPDSTLDWVAYHTTVTGKSREWALLASFAQLLQGGRHAVLQARVAEHRALKMRLDDGTLLDEPPAVEGYLTLHRANGPKELIYASSIEGVVFIAPANDAMPPLIPKRPGSMPAALFPEVFREFRCNEQRRMTSFIEKCTGCIDLRDIVDVVLRKPRDEPEGGELSTRPLVVHATSGHISTRKPTSKAGDKKEREFNVTFRNGNVVAFEAHTPDVAREWVWHLSQLVEYWTRYHRVHARLQMSTNTLHARAWVSELDRHMEEALNKVWNWCIIDGCRAITMCSRLYVKRGKYRKFKANFAVITGGSIITFRIKASTGLQPRRHVWPLFGAYIYSGMLAQEELRETVNEMAFNPPARMYPDGLRSTDGAEDTTFCIRLTWTTGTFATPQPWDWGPNDTTKVVPPRLRQEPSEILICRARSRLERDRWVWALNAEKERCTRAHVAQEEALRNYGNLPRVSNILHTNGTVDCHPAFGHRNSSRTSLTST